MNLCIRDVFAWRDSRWRLVALDKPNAAAWIIDLTAHTAWPTQVPLTDIEDCQREANSVALDPRRVSIACDAKLPGDYALVQRILHSGANLLNPDQRKRCIETIAHLTARSTRTLERLLR